MEEENPELYESVKAIKDWADYEAHSKEYYGEVSETVLKFYRDIVPGDVIWMHSEDGCYYFAQVKEESAWKFCTDQEARENNASNQRINIRWHKVEDWNSIPIELRNRFKLRQPFLDVPASAVRAFTLEQLRRLENENS